MRYKFKYGKQLLAVWIVLVCMITVVLSGCTSIAGSGRDTNRIGGNADTKKKVTVQNFTGQVTESDFVQNKLAVYWERDLPPVAERLPSQPVVVNAAGAFSDKLQLPFFYGVANHAYISEDLGANTIYSYIYYKTALRENVIEFIDGELRGNIFTEWSVDDSGCLYQFTIREGVRWSDGSLVTVDDARFALEDVWGYWANQPLKSGEVNPYRSFSSVWNWQGKENGELPIFKRITDFCFSVTYSRPDMGLAQRMAFAEDGCLQVLMPVHFYAPLHTLYGGEQQAIKNMTELEIMNEKDGFYRPPEQSTQAHSWEFLFGKTLEQRDLSPDWYSWTSLIPVLSPWVYASMGEPLKKDWMNMPEYNEQLDQIRNPYYWKVDAQGLQLPYYDKLWISTAHTRYHEYNDNDFCVAIQMDDEITSSDGTRYMTQYQFSESNPLCPLYLCSIPEMTKKEAELETQKRQMQSITTGCGWGLELNYNSGDANWRKAIEDERFRTALSMALDRQKLVDLFGSTMQRSSLAPDYDLQTAKALLAESGHNPTIRLQPGLQWLMPGNYQDELFLWLAESWTALGLNVTLTGVAQEWDIESTVSCVSLCMSPDPKTPLLLPAIQLPQEVDETFREAQAAWLGGYGSYEDYCLTLQKTQMMLPLVETVQIPAHTSEGMQVTGTDLPTVWQNAETWFVAE